MLLPPCKEQLKPELVLQRVFKAFQYRDFRLMWIGACTSAIGTWMQIFAQGWLIWKISHSARLLALDPILQAIPIFLFSLVGGVLADRFERRHLLIFSQCVQMACAVILTVLVGFHVVKVWHFLTGSFIVGFAQAFGGPAYSALIPTLVPKEDMPNAIALNSMQFNAAVAVGPALGGWALYSLGETWCFALNALSFLAPVVALLMLTIRFLPEKATGSMLNSLQEGILFVRKQGAMGGLIVLAFCMAALGVPMRTFLPLFATQIFHRGSGIAATFLSMSGAGSVVGALGIAALERSEQRPAGSNHADRPWYRRFGLCTVALASSHVRQLVFRRRSHDGRLLDGEFAGSTDCHQPDARPRDECIQPLFPQRHAHGKPDRRLARPNFYGAGGAGRERSASGLSGALLFSGPTPRRRALI